MPALYPWFLWLHTLSAILFFFTHGTAMAIAFRLPAEKDANVMKALLNITGITIAPLGISTLGLLISSVYMGIAARWWTHGWWWIAFVLMFGMMIWMTIYGRQVYSPIRKALGMEYMTGFSTSNPAVEPAGMGEVERLVAKSNPRLLAWVGFVVTAIVLGLMTFKPL